MPKESPIETKQLKTEYNTLKPIQHLIKTEKPIKMIGSLLK
jgi:hypothetical protein